MKTVRITLVAVFFALALAGAASGERTRAFDAPKVASLPTLTQTADLTTLVAGNGGWFADSEAHVDFYVFRWFRDGVLFRGAASVPRTQEWGQPPLAGSVCTASVVSDCGTYPTSLAPTRYTLTSADYGHQLCVDVYGGAHTRYVYSWGEVAWDLIEFGHRNATDSAEIPLVCVTPQAPTQPPPPTPRPNPSAALAVFANATLPARRAAKLYATWKAANPREAGYLEAYDAAVQARRVVAVPKLSTAAGRTFVATDEQAAWDAGVHP